MVVNTEEFEEFEGVEFRDYENKEPCSVSAYGDIQRKEAHNVLVEASKNLLPLADYIEENYTPDLTENADNQLQLNGITEER